MANPAHYQSNMMDARMNYDGRTDVFASNGGFQLSRDSGSRLRRILENKLVPQESSDGSGVGMMPGNIFMNGYTTPSSLARRNDDRMNGAMNHNVPSNEQIQRTPITSGFTKLVKMKMWDPGDPNAQPFIVTVAVDAPTRQYPNGAMNGNTDSSLAVGQRVNIRTRQQHDGGESASVDIWQTSSTTSTSIHAPLQLSPVSQLSDEIMGPAASSNRDALASGNGKEPEPKQPANAKIPEQSIDIHSAHSNDSSRITNSSSMILTVSTTGDRSSNLASTTSNSTEVRRPRSARQTSFSSSVSVASTISNEEGVKGLEPFTIPSVISATAVKRRPDEKVGIAFRKANGSVMLEKIVLGSAFDGTALRPGNECLSINGHRVRSARRAAEIVREATTSLTLMVSNAPRPPGTMYTMIALGQSQGVEAAGMNFRMKHGLVQLTKVDQSSPVINTSMKVGDFILAINGVVIGDISRAVKTLSEAKIGTIPILYFNMRQLRVSLVDKVIGELWKKEWSENYDECVVLQPGGSSTPLTLRFKEEGMCELLDPSRANRVTRENGNDEFRPTYDEPSASPDHPLNSVVTTLNHGVICVLAAIREGVELATSDGSVDETGDVSSGNNIMGNLAKLADMYSDGLLNKEDFEAIKSKLLS